MCGIVEQTIVGYEPFFDVRLLVFPEFAHAAPIYDSVAEAARRLAVPVPNEHTDRYHKLCQKLRLLHPDRHASSRPTPAIPMSSSTPPC